MEFQAVLPLQGVGGELDRLVEAGVAAEEAGWDGVALEDYVSYYREGPLYDPWMVLAALAVRTERIRLALEVTPLARRRPWKVAREAVTLDHLSEGRFRLGVGVGDDGDASFTHFGEAATARERADRLDEALDIITGLWKGEPFSYRGRHFQVRELTFRPRPVQRPRIPIWVGGGWPREGPLRRAARWDGAVFYKVPAGEAYEPMTPEDIRALRDALEARREAVAPIQIATGGVTPGDDPAAARANLEPLEEAGADVWAEFLPETPEALERRIEEGPPRWR